MENIAISTIVGTWSHINKLNTNEKAYSEKNERKMLLVLTFLNLS